MGHRTEYLVLDQTRLGAIADGTPDEVYAAIVPQNQNAAYDVTSGANIALLDDGTWQDAMPRKGRIAIVGYELQWTTAVVQGPAYLCVFDGEGPRIKAYLEEHYGAQLIQRQASKGIDVSAAGRLLYARQLPTATGFHESELEARPLESSQGFVVALLFAPMTTNNAHGANTLSCDLKVNMVRLK